MRQFVSNGHTPNAAVCYHANKVYLSVNDSSLTWISRVYSRGASGSNTRLDLRVPVLSRVKEFSSFPDTMRKSNGGPFLGESLSLTDSFSRVLPAAWFSWTCGEREWESRLDAQLSTGTFKQTHEGLHLYDGCGVGWGEDRGVIVDVSNVDV